MSKPRRLIRAISALALLAIVVGCASTDSGRTDLLSAAGFKLVPADTPKKQELLATLTPDKLTLIVWKGKQLYVEPAGNNQAYVGTEKEYQTYQQLRLAKQISNDNLMAAQMSQASMSHWGVWGPSLYGGVHARGIR